MEDFVKLRKNARPISFFEVITVFFFPSGFEKIQTRKKKEVRKVTNNFFGKKSNICSWQNLHQNNFIKFRVLVTYLKKKTILCQTIFNFNFFLIYQNIEEKITDTFERFPEHLLNIQKR